MARTVPMVRTAAAGPVVQWLLQNNRPVERLLSDADFSFLPLHDPMQAVPLHNVARLLKNLCRIEGPDLPTRIIKETGDVSLAMMGPFAISAQTPREAFKRVSAALPYFSSHEHFVLEPTADGGKVRQFWGTTFDRETLHYLHQFVAALIELFFSLSSAPCLGITDIELLPHPAEGLGFLEKHFQSPLSEGHNILTIRVSKDALDMPFRNFTDTRGKPTPPLPDLESLRADDSLAGTASIALRAMLETGKPTVDKLARTAGFSPRTFQRLLKDEGTSYSRLLADVRREAALDWIESGEGTLAELSVALGYSHPSAFSRAMRRWTGILPMEPPKKG